MKLSLHKVRVMINGNEVLHDISFEACAGEICGLLGKNGSGKTTTLLSIIGAYHITGGYLYLDDCKLNGMDIRERIEKGLLIVPQSLHQFWITCYQDYGGYIVGMNVYENVYAVTQDHEAARDWLLLFGLEGVKEVRPSDISWGQQQRLALLRMCALEPKVLLMDEVFGAADWHMEAQLKAFLKKNIKDKGIIGIYTASNPHSIEGFCSKQVMVENGTTAV